MATHRLRDLESYEVCWEFSFSEEGNNSCAIVFECALCLWCQLGVSSWNCCLFAILYKQILFTISKRTFFFKYQPKICSYVTIKT